MVRLLRASLTDVRNYAHLNVSPGPGLNVLSGPNGSGKTNLLEAVSLLQPGRGLRAARPEHIARHGASEWAVASRLETGGEIREIGTGTVGRGDDNAARGRIFRLDGAGVRSQADIAGIVSIVWLTPQMERLFGEAASGRRRFLDRLVAGLDSGHARALAAHEAAVAGRNRLLAERRGETAWLSAAEDAIARHAAAATASRLAFCRRMNLAADPSRDAFPAARLDLSCPIAARLQAEPARLVEDWLRTSLADGRDADAATGNTAIGAHRCDLAIHEHATGLPVHLASTGQQKSLLVGIVLAHASLIEADRGEPPLLLLDEPLVHLDAQRRQSLFARMSAMAGQVLMTGTDEAMFEPLARDAVFWRVGNDTVVGARQSPA